MTKQLPLGPLMIDIAGIALTELDRERLRHPLVGGVILFTRNYADPDQLTALTTAIHALREPSLLIAVDHEGGRVQRFREGFTNLPAMAALGKLWDSNPESGKRAAFQVGYVLASELRACGVDYSFTPVLDLDFGPSRVIGDRAFHRNPETVVVLAAQLTAGLKAAGMGSCGKHFPGHGFVIPDSHVDLPVDHRPLESLQEDLFPYRQLGLDGVMAAHMIYECFDCNTAVFSNKWINYLRNNIKFDGAIFTDDLSMAGAGVVGDMCNRVEAAFRAGCDMLLICNSPEAVDEVLLKWHPQLDCESVRRITALRPEHIALAWEQLQQDPIYRDACESLQSIGLIPAAELRP